MRSVSGYYTESLWILIRALGGCRLIVSTFRKAVIPAASRLSRYPFENLARMALSYLDAVNTIEVILTNATSSSMRHRFGARSYRERWPPRSGASGSDSG